ncbi:2-oxoglutarate synthase, subunit alpha [Rhodospirillum rubrum F11]|uniref:2-oxoglutarate synthase, alpha subunit n=2 Tax=Rhodospirillum rubrum TaxID=1085 RepID=Q2RQS7_RHORT|nr:2-oxoacid:acceptor oxidoreductase subunit alpha [Rhodospirillum rubrum]ABC23518.1 2-oxoglutarate synthase, alpha subunit [Rhodospirillum rubrum ATCC 11170]AEO49257.1 2-oxoglutarate synthase, subunit alpha [Rhodospirillum rubrum F11]MBK5955191.1 2-oxoglutarate synthase [Rhodospirillum rubrum]QXG79485.1 2-oxoacid:acceptor oxidoreductase subunit alpha [Rhodospirillum rubrum]HCF16832.1 2-oxoacid:acceptor oxidoreductase subunit alpha [Rhodospirillum rubrum]
MMTVSRKAVSSVSIALTGSGGAGVMTAGQILLDAAARAGFYGLMAKSLGPQIRGGESAALLRLSTRPVETPDDVYDILLAVDWGNVERFSAELPLAPTSVILADPAQGVVPPVMRAADPIVVDVALKELAAGVPGGRVNMVALGLLAALIGLPQDSLAQVLAETLEKKGPAALDSSLAALRAGAAAAEAIPGCVCLPAPPSAPARWLISGNEASAFGALKGGIRFVAAYPITPATEILEWLAPELPKVGGCLVQAEDELASINMILGGSFGGVPALTATSGPGLALMTESLGLGVASETPIVVCNVMRGGPSTGIPTKSEQVDLNIALYGLHGDAPHVVTAPNGIGDCAATTQWSVHLAEAMQVPVIVLSDQAMGQSRAIIDKPATRASVAQRLTAPPRAKSDETPYARYGVTASGISPMAVPGTPGCAYTADGLEHSPRGMPSTQASHHGEQLDKRLRKLTGFAYGDAWADIEGDGPTALITWGSVTAAAREAAARLAEDGIAVRLISLRLIAPALPEAFAQALAGVSRALIVEQNHGRQFYRYLRSVYDLPADTITYNRPGPVVLRPHEIVSAVKSWGARVHPPASEQTGQGE